jgi:hypothetical protein
LAGSVAARIPEALPDGETDLGIVEEDERIITRERATPLGIRLEALKLKHDDPAHRRHRARQGDPSKTLAETRTLDREIEGGTLRAVTSPQCSPSM